MFMKWITLSVFAYYSTFKSLHKQRLNLSTALLYFYFIPVLPLKEIISYYIISESSRKTQTTTLDD